MEICVLNKIKVLVFKERFIQKSILICPPFLWENSLDIRILLTPEIGNFVVVMNPTLMDMEPSQEEGKSNEMPQTMNRSMNIIIWNLGVPMALSLEGTSEQYLTGINHS